MMRSSPTALEASYAARAIPKGSARYWSHLFAAPEAQAPLLGIYALLAEWQALFDPATEHAVAQLKLGWWQEEIRRLAEGRGAHPICVYLAKLPGAAGANFGSLQISVAAAINEASGVPVARAQQLPAHAAALWGRPLIVAAEFAASRTETQTLTHAIETLAQGEYLSFARSGYRRAAKFGRVAFAVDELLQSGIENSDLTAEGVPDNLGRYLEQVASHAARQYREVKPLLPAAARAAQRHLLILADLGERHLQRSSAAKTTDFRDMLCAWRAARRAQA